MPVHSCQEGGKPGWKWGGRGKCYTYTRGDEEGSKRAKAKANKQGAAARASGYVGANDGDELMDEELLIQKARGRHSGIQSLRFDKKKFNKSQAVAWAKSHGFRSGDVEETPNQWRLRQFPPKSCLRSGGIKEVSNGVQAYICATTGTIKKAIEDIKDELEEIKNSIVEKDGYDSVLPQNVQDLPKPSGTTK